MKHLISLLIIFISLNATAQQIDYSVLTSILQKHVSPNGQVNYKAIKTNKASLDTYLKQYSKISPKNSWSKEQVLAYWINAYNAFTIELIIDNYPIKSIKDLKKPWNKEFIPLANKKISLNYIEHEILRTLNEPRVHFAIVCASASCPKLLNEAYTPEKLNKQLTQATKDFLSDTSRNKISESNIEISKIFKWFAKDFKKNGSLIDFINTYSDIRVLSNANIDYLDYNWSLNE
ncbi:DUF547 domain-containing protein [Corallibacter sp.]|uniref:DUF547 domain-containing protein n=1 Tax=Corallibacter sp. TaxID=2038084 RepID=UPI003AB650EB